MMDRLFRAALIGAAIASLSGLAPAQAQPPSVPPPRPDLPRQPGGPGGMPRRDLPPVPEGPTTAEIRGRIVAADSGHGLRRVVVRLSAREMRQSRIALTDAEGRFEFKELPAGRYSLMASKGGYVNSQYGERRPGDMTGRPLELAAGQVVEKIQFALAPGGVIAGRVVDELGEPVADAMVSAQRFRSMGGRRRMMMAGRPGQSNDIGQFRIFGLPPGEYYLSASIRGGGMMMGGDEVMGAETTGYAPTFYPGTPSVDEAQRVRVEAGQEVTADLQMVPAKLSRITGIVVSSAGKPPQGGMIMVAPRADAGTFMSNMGQVRHDGTFTINGLAPGTYDLNVRANFDVERVASTGSLGGGEFAIVPVTVAGEDVTGLRIVTSKGVTVAGQVMYEGGVPPADAEIRVMAPPESDGPSMLGFSSARVRPDGTFDLENVLGSRRVNVVTPRGWMLKSIAYRGRDITDAAVQFQEAGPPGRLQVVLTNRLTVVSGSVQAGDGRPATDYEVIIFPGDPDKVRFPSRGVRSAKPDQQGVYRVESLPPGEYLAVALTTVDEDQRFEPEFLERLRGVATPFAIREGETRAVSLKLSPSP